MHVPRVLLQVGLYRACLLITDQRLASFHTLAVQPPWSGPNSQGG